MKKLILKQTARHIEDAKAKQSFKANFVFCVNWLNVLKGQ